MLKNYNVSKMDPKLIKALKTPELLGNPIFTYDFMMQRSSAAAYLAKWVINVIRYNVIRFNNFQFN